MNYNEISQEATVEVQTRDEGCGSGDRAKIVRRTKRTC